MCGIFGYLSNNIPVDGNELCIAHNKMANRGPDDEGFVVFDNSKIVPCRGDRTIDEYKSYIDIKKLDRIYAVFSHTRLSIIDLTSAAHQPFVSEDERYVMTYNGEVYNYLQLRNELVRCGETFRTNSDTEVVLKSYIRWGKSAFNKFNGMWALAIYDRKENKTVICRDRFGIKPLFYFWDNDSLIFASDINSILQLKRDIKYNINSINKYINNCYIYSDNETFFDKIHEVPPASYIEFCNKEIKSERYWELTPVIVKRTEDEAIEYMRYLFDDAVKLRMRSDVEVGSLLSGGLDSNAIVGTLGKLGYLNNNYKTFSAVYDDERFSEEKYIRKTQKKWDIKSYYLKMNSEVILEDLDKVLMMSGTPIRAVPMIMQYEIYKYIKNNTDVKVVLNGQGADELFGGYTDNYYTLFYSLIRKGHYLTFIKNAHMFMENRNKTLRNVLSQTYHQKNNNLKGIARDNIFNEITYKQITETPLREYLMYDDRASMAFGIEARAPFMDYRIVEFAFSLEEQYKINEENNKYILRKSFSDVIDRDILDRKDKMGFTSPQEIWQKNEWNKHFNSIFEEIDKNGILDFNKQEIVNRYGMYMDDKFNNWPYIWRIFCLKRWIDIYSV